MKDLNMLVWLTQLGLSTVLPLAAFCVIGIWLHRGRGCGVWTVWAGLLLGLICTAGSFRNSLKAMERMAEAGSREPPPTSFNEHK